MTLPESASASPERSDWAQLRYDLRRRTTEPFGHVPFVVYLISAVIILGGLGIWFEAAKLLLMKPAPPDAKPTPVDLGGLIAAVITFFPALIGSASLQLVLARANHRDKILMSFGLLVLIASAAIAIVLALLSEEHGTLVLSLGSIFCLGAIWIWIIASADDDAFRRAPAAVDAAAGGDPARALPGTLDGFEI